MLKAFGCKTLSDYHYLYLKTDVSLLADVLENLRNPSHYFTSPGLSWDALLKKTEVDLELLTDLEMFLFVERGIQGGVSMVRKKYTGANNPLVEGYDPSKRKQLHQYLDANNLYRWAMCKPLPVRIFKWKRVMHTEEEILKKKKRQERVDPRG